MKRSVVSVLALFVFGLGSQLPAFAGHEDELAVAHQHYEAGHWQQAWDAFATLADRGEVASARMVIRMTRFGPQLFRQDWQPAPERLARWHAVAAGEPAVRTAVRD